jgi:hypothetical protein
MKKVFQILILILFSGQLLGQTAEIHAESFDKNGFQRDSLNDLKRNRQVEMMSLLTYIRVISDSKGSVRTDENVVTNFKLLNWLKLELGLRYGERPEKLNSYYHYKVELQTKSFWKTTRFIARISDNVVDFPYPAYKKTNGLFLIQSKYPLSKSFQSIVGAGYLFSFQQQKDVGPMPTFSGTRANYPLFKLALRYLVKNKGFVEFVYGSYDVFNPYQLNRPFTQLGFEYEFNHSCKLYSYARYQYDNNVLKPYNYFFGLGLLFHLSADTKQ